MADSNFEVEEKHVDDMLICGILMTGKYSDCGKAFSKLGRAFGRYIRGDAMLLHYDLEYKEHEECKSTPLQWLKEEVKSDRFLLRKRVPVESNKEDFQGQALAIYEYKDRTFPKEEKLLIIKMPLIKATLKIPFYKLLEK